jgi:hypothetical protein
MKGLVVIGALTLATLSWAQSNHAENRIAGPASVGPSLSGAHFRLASREGSETAFSENKKTLRSDARADRWIDSIAELSNLVAGESLAVPFRKAHSSPVSRDGWPIRNVGPRETALPALLITSILGLAAFGLMRMRRKG